MDSEPPIWSLFQGAKKGGFWQNQVLPMAPGDGPRWSWVVLSKKLQIHDIQLQKRHQIPCFGSKGKYKGKYLNNNKLILTEETFNLMIGFLTCSQKRFLILGIGPGPRPWFLLPPICTYAGIMFGQIDHGRFFEKMSFSQPRGPSEKLGDIFLCKIKK